MPNTNPSAASLANSCRWCGGALPAGADLHGACRSEYLASPLHQRELDRAANARDENAAWDRADRTAELRADADQLGDDGAARDEREYYVGTAVAS